MTTTATTNSSSIPSHIVVPEEFICPITMEIFQFPLATKNGCNYEREAIIAWLRQGNSHCPLTRKPLCAHDMIHNNYLAAEIAKWRAANGLLVPSSVVSHDQTTPNANEDSVARNSDQNHNGEEMDTAEEQRLAHIYGTAALPYREVVPAFSKKSKSSSRRRRTADSAATATTAATASPQQRHSASSSIGSSVKSLLASAAPKCFFTSPKKPSKVSRAVAA
jgi:U-box domain